ncbi:type IX secretion system membrane protein PorP/SprF [Pedobacter sp. BS3]|uniref:PorP/SprF family type IX secretion system membrane protein n=1 Tax=Pedobacter sp. BS3 TaxID=2567937 RepID=UPI0011EE523D|nr:type IX secretion system membrane protein PorP/SprF [Pedobacter sp. BS3]TZF84987.1 type IX secretion system membrane protein PorP/SprF [Pedobacter sp. BS3]
MKRTYIYITFIIQVLSCSAALAQQDAMYSQYMFNTMAINPAYAGSRNVVSATALYRSQWTGIAGAPKTFTFTIDAPVSDKKIGLGLQLFNDKLGITRNTGVSASYAYRIRMSDQGTLALGIQGTAAQYRADFTSVALDPYGTSNDAAFRDNVNQVNFNAGFGAYYNSDRFYVGLSAMELLSNEYYNTTGTPYNPAVHLFLAAGYVFKLNDDFNLKPSVLVKGVKGAPVQADGDLALWIKDVIAVGATYRTNADVGATVQLQVSPQIRIGYQYDYSTTKLQNYNSGSHEIMLRYEFGRNRDRILTPRYF